MLCTLNILTILFVNYRLTKLKRKKKTDRTFYLPMIFELVYITEACCGRTNFSYFKKQLHHLPTLDFQRDMSAFFNENLDINIHKFLIVYNLLNEK